MNDLMMEDIEWCPYCDSEMHVMIPDSEDFHAGKIGRIRCSCGRILEPCDLCSGCNLHDDCDTCPWENASIVNDGGAK